MLSILVNATEETGATAPSGGYVTTGTDSGASGPRNDTAFLALGQALDPGFVRIGTTTINMPVTWNATTDAPTFGWLGLDQALNYSVEMNSTLLLSVPAGTWGNGNELPAGMPLDHAFPILFNGSGKVGYFPTPEAYRDFLEPIAAHVQASGVGHVYWSIGNEVPRVNVTEVAAFITLFNAAASTIHRILPTALVGSDVMMDKTYLPEFAQLSRGVGFLSFHYYAAAGICLVNGSYCPPSGGMNGTTDPTLVDGGSGFGRMWSWDAPHLSQILWHNLTGAWLPVLDSEVNLNHMGGQYTASIGTDPRIQTLFNAAWLGHLFIDGTQQNLSSILYFTLAGPEIVTNTSTSPWGGWGFQMAGLGPTGNYTIYAPYWAMMLWAQAVPHEAPALETSGSVPTIGEAQAYQNGTGISVLLVNRVNSTVRFSVDLADGEWAPTSLRILDRLSYLETYNSTSGQEQLYKSGLLDKFPGINPVVVTIRGYGIAVLSEVLTPAHIGQPLQVSSGTRNCGAGTGPSPVIGPTSCSMEATQTPLNPESAISPAVMALREARAQRPFLWQLSY
jgi:hypothetical protein